jgi:hypothetical protein
MFHIRATCPCLLFRLDLTTSYYETLVPSPVIQMCLISDTKPTKCTNLFLRCLYYNFTLTISTFFGPQGDINRASNQSNITFPDDSPLRAETCKNIQCDSVIQSVRLRWSTDSVLAFCTQGRGFKPGRSRRIFRSKKILSTPSFGGEVKQSVPCRALRYVKEPKSDVEVATFGKISRPFLAHSSTFRY